MERVIQILEGEITNTELEIEDINNAFDSGDLKGLSIIETNKQLKEVRKFAIVLRRAIKILSSNERESDRKHSKAKEFCTFTTENHIYCSRYHDCKYCDLQPKTVQNG